MNCCNTKNCNEAVTPHLSSLGQETSIISDWAWMKGFIMEPIVNDSFILEKCIQATRLERLDESDRYIFAMQRFLFKMRTLIPLPTAT
jgi:hypothetical protein